MHYSELLSSQLRRRLFRMARRLTASDADAEDAVQRVLTRILERGIPKDHPNPEAYICLAVKRQAIDMNRRKATERQMKDRLKARASPEGMVSVDRVEVRHALSKLDPEARRLLELRIEGRTFAEIAAVQGCSTSAAYQRVDQAIRDLERLLRPQA